MRVEIEGDVVERDVAVLHNGEVFTVDQIRDDSGWTHFVFTNERNTTYRDPAGWPPECGDVWKTATDGHEYYVHHSRMSPPDLVVCSREMGGPVRSPEALKNRGAELIHRSGTDA